MCSLQTHNQCLLPLFYQCLGTTVLCDTRLTVFLYLCGPEAINEARLKVFKGTMSAQKAHPWSETKKRELLEEAKENNILLNEGLLICL